MQLLVHRYFGQSPSRVNAAERLAHPDFVCGAPAQEHVMGSSRQAANLQLGIRTGAKFSF